MKAMRILLTVRDAKHYGLTLRQLSQLVTEALDAGYSPEADVLTGSTEAMRYVDSLFIRELA